MSALSIESLTIPRAVKRTSDRDARLIDDRAKVRHEESLHPHDAVAVITRGVRGGLTA